MVVGSALLGGAAGGAIVSVIINAVDNVSPVMKSINKGMLVTGAAIAGIGLVVGKALVGLTKDASDLQESMNAVNVVFGEGSKIIEEFGRTSATSIGLATSEFNQMSAVTGALLKDVGLPMEEVAQLTTDLTVRASDLASVFNTDVSLAMSAINQALRGETEAIRKFAGDVTDATLNEFLLAKGLNKTTKDLTQQEKRLLRVQLIMEQTANVAGDFANTSDNLANRQRILNASLTDLRAEMGVALLPVMESVVGVIQKLVTWFSNLSPQTKKIITGVAALTAVLAVLGGVLVMIVAVSGALAAIWAPVTLTVLAVVAAIGLLIAAGIFLARNWDTIKEKGIQFFKFLKNFFAPEIALIKVAVKALGIAFRFLWDHGIGWVWDKMKLFVTWIKDTFLSTLEKVVGLLGKVASMRAGQGAIIEETGSKVLGSFQKGGIVPETGNFQLHKGETVIPANQSGNGGNTNIIIQGDNFGVDAEQIAIALNDMIKAKISL